MKSQKMEESRRCSGTELKDVAQFLHEFLKDKGALARVSKVLGEKSNTCELVLTYTETQQREAGPMELACRGQNLSTLIICDNPQREAMAQVHTAIETIKNNHLRTLRWKDNNGTVLWKLHSSMSTADLSGKGLGEAGARIVSEWFSSRKDTGAMTSLNLSNNNIGELVKGPLPEGWKSKDDDNDAPWLRIADGHVQDEYPGEEKPEGVIAIAKAIPTMEALVSTNFLNNGIGVKQAQNLVTILQEHATLKSLCGNTGDETELDMSGKDMGADDAIMLVPEITDNRALVKLTLGGDVYVEYNRYQGKNVTVTPEVAVLEVSMKEANLSEKNLGAGGAIIVGAWICNKDNGAMTKLDIRSNYKNKEGMGYSYKSEEFITPIAEMLKTNTMITELNVSSNWLNLEAVRILSDAIRSNMSLTSVNILNNNNIGVEQAQNLVAILNMHPTLKSLCGNKGGDETELDMSAKKMGYGGAIMLAPEIVAYRELKTLNISNNEIGSYFTPRGATLGAEAISDAIKTKGMLKNLDISSNGFFRTDDAQRFADCISTNGALEKLTFNGGRFVDSIFDWNEGPAVTLSITMTTADLSNNQLGVPGAIIVGAWLSRNKGTLESLNISNNNIGELCVPPGWREGSRLEDGTMEYQHTDGRKKKDGIHKQRLGVFALKNGIEKNDTLKTLDISNNDIPIENVNEIMDIVAHKCERPV